MNIYVNEHATEAPLGTTLFGLRDQMKPDADVVVLNGAPASADQPLQDGDAVVFIRRGEVPNAEELEALMAARHTPGVHEAVKRSSVGIAGLGGLGSAIAIAIARIGVGRLVLADFDVVEPSNLNRQQYFVDQIGQLKTDALRDNLARIHADWAFIGCDGLSVEGGLTTTDPRVAKATALMAAGARRAALLTDSSKAGRDSFITFARFGDLDYLITDDGMPPKILAEARRAGVETIVVEARESQ